MIIECPNCGTNYTVMEEAIKPRGRMVRCNVCKQQWHADGSASIDLDALLERDVPFQDGDPVQFQAQSDDRYQADAASEADSEPVAAATPVEEPVIVPLTAAVPQVRSEVETSSHIKAAPTIGLLAVSVAALLLVVVAARHGLESAWPASQRLYNIAGMSAPANATGLELHNVHALLDPDPKGKGLTIEADVANVSSEQRTLPSLRATVVPDVGTGATFTFSSGMANLPPQGTVAVKASFAAAGLGNGKILLTFSPDNPSDSR